MKNTDSVLKATLKTLLDEKLPPAEERSLKDEGFELKKPTRKAALVIAIYKKAVSGDLSAIKELCNILATPQSEGKVAKAVMIIDDI